MKRASAAWLLVMLLAAACAPGSDGSSAALQTPTPTATASSSPGPGDPLRFVVIGDFGTGWPVQHEIARRMCKWRERHPFDLVITTGDNIYPDGAPEHFQEKFFDPYRCLLEGGVEFHASLGNHDFFTDRGRPEIEEPVFGMPKRNYVLRTGGVRFVVVDSNTLDREWLSEALKPRPLDRWTIPVFHFPVYSPGTHRGSTAGYRPSLPQLFRERGVDLVLNGHDHLYAVTNPLRRIRYVVTGGGGGGLYPCGQAWFSARCESRYHFLYVVASATDITVRAVPAEGKPFHRFVTMGRN